jgi:hypothetical protein
MPMSASSTWVYVAVMGSSSAVGGAVRILVGLVRAHIHATHASAQGEGGAAAPFQGG